MNFHTLKDLQLKGKRVLLRADLNVPAQRSKVTDTTRIDRLKPTIDYLRAAGAKVLILSHFGRPEGEQNPEMSLAFMLPTLEECWQTSVRFAPDCIGEKARQAAESLQDGEILLLENVRFHKGEKANDPAFIKELASLGDIYVNDAFSAAHRAHASTEGLARILPSAAGLLMEKELKALDAALENPQRPVAAITGGSKISSKLNVLNNLINKVDYLILGGGMANTFMNAKGINVGASLCEHDMAEEARTIMKNAGKHGCEIILPIDCVTVKELRIDAPHKIVPANEIPADEMAIDIGPQSINSISKKLQSCKTLLWNGPMGVFEIKPFDTGTNALAREAARLTKENGLVSVAGGGDTTAALENAGCSDQFTYISTAGGAFLEWLEGKTLPGIAALDPSNKKAA
ncbi:MAG: phosphoglycerate kinase [Alphaproteobacteria bacterium]|nr:phosphoglycerate kinase [Alphaproteobacteria bacterium]